MNKNSRMTKAFQIFILGVILVCVSALAVFLILIKYKSFESNQSKSGRILETAHSDETQSPMVQVNPPSPPQSDTENSINIQQALALSQDNPSPPPRSAETVNSISTQQALTLSQDSLSDRTGEVDTPLFTKDQQAEAKKKAVVSEVLSMLTHQPKYSTLSAEESAKKLATLLDKETSLKECRKAAWILAKEGDTETLSALKQILADPTSAPDLKTAIVEGFAYSADPQKKEVFLSALNDPSETVALAAIKGLAVVGDEDCVSVLSDIAWSPDGSSNTRSEAIMSLGKIPDPTAYKSLVDLYSESASQKKADSQEEIITALGQRDITETGAFFDQILKGKEADPALRVAVAESFEEAQGDVSPFLVNMLHDEDSKVRAAAAWTLATREEPGNVLQEVQALLGTETDPEVRMRLYQAMGNQETFNIDAVAPAILNESDPEVRSAGYDLLAKSISSSENTELKGQFDKAIVPELKETALTADKLNSRLGAIISLKRANTEQSYRALEEIAAQSKDSRVVQATGILK